MSRGMIFHAPSFFYAVLSQKDALFCIFFVKGKNIKDYEIRIMSKAKVLVYSSTDINEQWDGTHNGEALDRGVYIYMIVFTDLNNKVHHKNGTITLIRQN